MDDLIAEFVAECREMLDSLSGEIVAWESEPHDRARLDSIFRFVHTVKGNCGFLDFPRLEALSHAAEDALADVRAGRRQADAALVSAVLAVIDRIGEMVAAIEAGDEFPAGDDLALLEALEPGADGSGEQSLAAGPVPGEAKAATAAPRTIRLSVELLDRVMSGVSDMVLARNELARRLRDTPGAAAVEGAFERLSAIIAEMRDAITRTRMQRVENLFSALPRMVRDLSAELGKQVLIDIDGGDVELDREMIEMIRDPLTHIIRNAIDHGIELPAERREAGKREIGILSVSARQSGNQILIDIADDGRGIDSARLAEKAVAAGSISAEVASHMADRDRLALIFEPGLSTAEAVTAISGRGVGMDVVRSNVERIGGLVEVESVLGKGTRMTLRVPLTLTIMPALTVSIAGQQFAIPRSAIEEIVRLRDPRTELVHVGEAMLVTIRGRRLPCATLAEVLGMAAAADADGRTLIVLRPAGGDLFALAVDCIHDHEELVVKPAAPAIMSTGLYAGTTLADDGRPILLLDPAGLASAAGLSLDGQDRAPVQEAAPDHEAPATPVLLFDACDGHRRAVRLAVVDRIEEVEASAVQLTAGQLRVVLGDRILPLAGIAEAPTGRVRLFRLADGESQIGYAFREVIDLETVAGTIGAASPGEIEGVTLIDGQPVELIDAHWLFARLACEPVAATAPVCRLPSNDAWIQNLLRPIIEAAGYRVVDESDEVAADVAIAAIGSDPMPGEAGRILWLRTTLDEPPGGDASIYRYDRAGLLSALKTVPGRAQ